MDVTSMMVTHAYVQASTDAATDAGVTQSKTVTTRTSTRNGYVTQKKRIVDEQEALKAAQRTFEKNMGNLSDMGLKTSNVERPLYSFPDERSMAGELNVQYGLEHSTKGMKKIFNDSGLTIPNVADSIHSESKMNSKK